MPCVELIFSGITAVSTLALLIVAWIQLNKMSKISRADFIHRLNTDFYRPATTDLFKKFDSPSVKFIETDESALFVDSRGNEVFNRYELNDFILGPLENVGTFERDGIIDLRMVYDICGSYVLKVWEKPFISEYVRWARRNKEDADTFECLESLYRKIKAYNQKKMG